MSENKIFIIAEAGINHNGSLDTALKMIDAAKNAGADAVKFQSFNVSEMITRTADKADYQKNTTAGYENQHDMLKALALSHEEHKKLIAHCNERNIIFLSSAFDCKSLLMLNDLGLEILKIPSGEITNLPYLRLAGSLNKQIIMSTGMSDLDEIKAALNVLISAGTPKNNIILLHTTTAYPTPYKDVNLKAMISIRNEFDMRTGYSDHTPGIEVAIAAAAMGACVIEKHFTISRKMTGPDHQASQEPKELKAMIQAVRNIEKALGSSIKKPSPGELVNISAARKSIVTKQSIKKGELLGEHNLAVKRPGLGVSPMKWDEVIGSRAIKDYKADEML